MYTRSSEGGRGKVGAALEKNMQMAVGTEGAGVVVGGETKFAYMKFA